MKETLISSNLNFVMLGDASSLLREARCKSKDPAVSSNRHRLLQAFSRTIASLLALLLISSFAAAQTLTGTVKNSTTGKPAAGDDVILLKLGQGMEEAGRTKADANGHFSFKIDDAQTPHLIRAIHQEVMYHRMAPPGTTSVEIEVFDAAKKVEGVKVVADIMRVQADQGQLDVMRAFAVQNESKPPRTQMNERNLEFYVPEGAKILEAEATTQNGNPLKSAPVPESGDKTRYAFVFPLRPGVTQFEVEYVVPYTGSANLDPKTIYPLQHFVAILPKGMQFSAAPGTNYQQMSDPQQPDANVQVASNAAAGQSLAFKISGTGTLQARGENGSDNGDNAPAAQNGNRPGGGLGPPIDAPDPLQQYRWWILGGLAGLLIAGAVFVAMRQQSANRAAVRSRSKLDESEISIEDEDFADTNGRETPSPATGRRTSSMLLEGLKEELFQLEIERRQGDISQQEYEKAKSALDQTLERALKRESAKQA
jgi:hypothetical protein